MTKAERYLFGKLEQSGDCLIFTGRKDRDGYGTYGDGANLVHRLAYETEYGLIPLGMTVDHLCFNRACCNPKHLRLLTRSANSKNQRSAFKKFCKHGHEFTPENTVIRKNGSRDCRSCGRIRVREYLKRKSA